MKEKLRISRNALTELINAGFYAGLIQIVLSLTERKNGWYLFAVPALVSVFYQAVREKIRNPALFFLLHALPFPALYLPFSGRAVERTVLLAASAACLAVSLMVKFGKKGADVLRFPVPAPLLSLAAAYLVVSKQGMTEAAQDTVSLLLFGVALFYVRCYLDHLEQFIGVNEQSNRSIPVRTMIRSGGGAVLFYTAAVSLCLSFGSHTRFGEGINALIARWLKRFFTLLFSLFHYSETETAAEKWSIYERQLEERAAGSGGELFLRILFAVICTAALFVFLHLFIRWLIRLMEAFRRERGPAASSLQAVCRDETTRVLKERKPKEELRTLFLHPEQKIRRIYRRFMEEEREKRPEEFGEALKKGTVRECVAFLSEEGDGVTKKAGLEKTAAQGKEAARAALLAYYEKARYSGASCNGQDVRRMKAAVRELKQR